MGRKSLPTDDNNLTERERLMLEFMKKNTLEKGYPPTVREICTELGVKSTSTVHKDLASLESKGFIRKDPAKPRAIEIVGVSGASASRQVASGAGDASGQKAGPGVGTGAVSEPSGAGYGGAAVSEVLEIPLIGQVAAGTPILAEQNVTDTFPVPARYVNGQGNHFMLTVKGESMIEAGIYDGDFILVKEQHTARNGEMVVAMIDGFESEATVKTFYNEGDHIRLQPENSSMSPILVRDVKILGTVRGVFRYFN